MCPPTIDCQITRLKSEYCETQGPFEPQLCKPGFFCPNASLQLPCPEGSYCIRGSFTPTTCPLLSHCPPGTEMRLFFGGIVVCLLIDAIMVALFLYVRYKAEPAFAQRRLALMRRRFGHDGGSLGEEDGGGVELLAMGGSKAAGASHSSRDAKAVLRDGFMRCNR